MRTFSFASLAFIRSGASKRFVDNWVGLIHCVGPTAHHGKKPAVSPRGRLEKP
jgi:hypothetical protein